MYFVSQYATNPNNKIVVGICKCCICKPVKLQLSKNQITAHFIKDRSNWENIREGMGSNYILSKIDAVLRGL